MEFLSRLPWELILIGILLAVALMGAHARYNPFNKKILKRLNEEGEYRKPVGVVITRQDRETGGRRNFRRTGVGRRKRLG